MEVPLTSFIDFVLKSGGPKMTCSKKIKAQLSEEYNPAIDYYKRFREAVQDLHSTGKDKSELLHLIGSVPDNKEDNYRLMAAGYRKFLGKKDVRWFQPPREVWKHGDLAIPINPEVGLTWEGQKFIIKLYLKAEKPSKDRFSSVLALMHQNLPTKDCQYGLLDVRNGKLYLFEEPMLALMPLVEGEAGSLEEILDKV